MTWQPLNARERRAWLIWGSLITVLGAYDASQHGASTLSEAGRAIRRRAGLRAWTIGWGLFSLWFWDHVRRR